jgi:hypothetical protein
MQNKKAHNEQRDKYYRDWLVSLRSEIHKDRNRIAVLGLWGMEIC